MGRAAQPKLAVVTGASTGIGYELAIQCAKAGFDLVVAVDESAILQGADVLRKEGIEVEHPDQPQQLRKAATNSTLHKAAL